MTEITSRFMDRVRSYQAWFSPCSTAGRWGWAGICVSLYSGDNHFFFLLYHIAKLEHLQQFVSRLHHGWRLHPASQRPNQRRLWTQLLLGFPTSIPHCVCVCVTCSTLLISSPAPTLYVFTKKSLPSCLGRYRMGQCARLAYNARVFMDKGREWGRGEEKEMLGGDETIMWEGKECSILNKQQSKQNYPVLPSAQRCASTILSLSSPWRHPLSFLSSLASAPLSIHCFWPSEHCGVAELPPAWLHVR